MRMPRCITLFAALIGVSTLGFAQIGTSTMTGRVTDQNGGVLPGVTVTVRDLGTRLTRTATTGAEGRFTIAALPVGSYELTAELQGFRRIVLSPVTTTVGEAVDLTLVLPVGGVFVSVARRRVLWLVLY